MMQTDAFLAPPNLIISLTEGPCSGQEVRSAKGGFNLTVGRTKKSKLHIKDSAVSETHAQLCWNGSAWVLRDTDSSNGTVVNGRKLQPLVEWAELHEGTEVLFGVESKGTVKLEKRELGDLTVEQMMSSLCEAAVTQIEARGQRNAKQLFTELGQAKAMLEERLRAATTAS